jgi:hypothetical protein
MSSSVVHPCGCLRCRADEPHADRALHQHINLLVSRLDEQQRRWFVALEAERFGRGGETLLAQITGLDRRTIRRGRRELVAGLAKRPTERIRAPGGGRPAREVQDPQLLAALEALLAPETSGDPLGRRAKGKRSSLRHLSAALNAAGHPASRPTVERLLRQLGYSPKANARHTEARSSPPERDAQFRHIAEQRAQFQAAGEPIISVDTKKKELVGDFKNAGRTWRRTAEAVLVHDWPQDAIGQAIPYGVYDLISNRGFVCIGDCFDTPRFAVEAISDWWAEEGSRCFRQAERLLILADAGGSNSCRSRVWKAQIQEQLCDACGLTVTVCHYPPGCSKWNPIEHRLFSAISVNWAGVPLRTFETIVRYIAGTITAAGLHVTALLKRGGNETGERVSDEEMRRLRLASHAVCPAWNYTLSPRTNWNEE